MHRYRLPSLLLAAHLALLAVAGSVLATAPGPRPAPVVARLAAAPLPAGAPVPVASLAPAPAGQTDRAVEVAPVGGSDRRTGPARPSRTRNAVALTPAQRGEQALAALRYPWRSLGYAVVFRPYAGRRLGHADPRTRTLTVYVKPGQDETELRTTIAHELGHALDFVHGTEQRRRHYLELRGIGARTWYPCAGCDDLSSPAGDWAEVFAAALVGTADFRSRLAGPPTPEHLRRLRALFAVPAPQAAAVPPAAAEQPPVEQEPAQEERGLWPLGLR